MQRIFSGIQPSGIPHLGNYLGAMKNWAALQRDHDCIYCVVDLHAITVWQDPKVLVTQTRELAASLIACGIDPKGSILFHQSAVHAHLRPELDFQLHRPACGWLSRMAAVQGPGRQRPGRTSRPDPVRLTH